jgi:sulfonate transport system permease protein
MVSRPEFESTPVDASSIGSITQPLSVVERLVGNDALRKLFVLVVLATMWESYARFLGSPLLFPTFTETISTFWRELMSGVLLERTASSMQVLLIGYATGLICAAVLTTVAVSTRIGTDFLTTLTAMFNPLPAIALLPLALIWFGLGIPSLVFVIVHSVLWAVSLNTLTGFRSVPDVLRMTGRNYGLHGVRYVTKILMPAAFPTILAGLKIGWAFAWRTLIAAELVFGVSSRSGGLGWYIFEARAQLLTAQVFSGLLAVIIIGLIVESVIFRAIETRTVQRWGMQH